MRLIYSRALFCRFFVYLFYFKVRKRLIFFFELIFKIFADFFKICRAYYCDYIIFRRIIFFKELKDSLPNVHFFGVGGDELKSLSMELIFHLNDFSSWGASEVLTKLPFYFKAADKLLSEIEMRQCKVAILIDFQDFNFRLAKKLKKRGVDVLYYVAPQAWAWRSGRGRVLGQIVHTLFTIIPLIKV